MGWIAPRSDRFRGLRSVATLFLLSFSSSIIGSWRRQRRWIIILCCADVPFCLLCLLHPLCGCRVIFGILQNGGFGFLHLLFDRTLGGARYAQISHLRCEGQVKCGGPSLRPRCYQRIAGSDGDPRCGVRTPNDFVA